MVDISNTAEIKLNVKVDKDGLNQLRRAMKSITTAAKADKAAKDMRLLTNQIEKLKKELREVKKESKAYQKAVVDANSKASESEKKAQAEIRKTRAERQKTVVAAKGNKKAEQDLMNIMARSSASMNKYISQMRQRIGTERTLQNVLRAKANVQAKQNATAQKTIAINRNLHASGQKFTIQIKKGQQDLQKYHMQLVRTANAQRKFYQSITTAKTWVGKFSNALSEAEGRMDALFRASFRLTIVGFTLQRFAQNIFRWGSSIMDVFEEFEFTLGCAAGALEVWRDETWDGVEATSVMRDEVLALAKELKIFTGEEVAKGLYFWGSATGQTVDSVEDLQVAMQGLDKIMKAAFMTNTDYEGTIKGVYSILTQFYSGDLSMAGDVTEKLFLSTQKTAAEWNDLIQSFKMVGPVAAQAGASFDQVNEAFGKLSDLGLRGSQAGRGLRQFFIQLVRPSGPAQKKWTELFEDNPFDKFDGRGMRDVIFPEGEFIGISEAIEQIAIATEHLNTADRVQAVARVTTANSLPLLIALMAQERNERLGLAEANDKLRKSDPAEYFRENWETLSNTWKAARGSLERVIESLKINLGTSIADALKPLIERLNQIVETVEEFIKLNPGLVEMAAQFAAVAAAGSMAAGVLFIIGGALVGLFAAFHLIFDAMGKWTGTIAKAIGVIGLFGAAIADNLDYLIEKGTEVVENLTAAFGDMDDALMDVFGVIERVTAPVRELFGILVRGAADVAVIISEIIKFASAVDRLANGVGWDAIITALTVITSARIISGLMSLVLGMRLFASTTVGAGIASSLTGVQQVLKIITSRSIITGIQLLTMKLRGLMAAMGPVGWAALGVSLLLTADQLPIIGGLVRSLSDDWKRLNGELKETVGYFGEDIASELEQLALEISPKQVELPAAKKVLAPWVEEANEWAKRYAPELDLLNKESTEADINDFLVSLMGEQNQWAGDNALVQAFYELTEKIREGNLLVNTALTDITADAVDYAHEWEESHKQLSQSIVRSGRNLSVSASEYGKAIIALTDNIRPGGAWVGGPNGSPMERGALVDNLVNAFLGNAPDKMTFTEFDAYLDSFNSNFAAWLAESISPSEAYKLFGDRIGAESSKTNDELIKIIEKQMLPITDPYALREAILEPLAVLDGQTVFDAMADSKNFGDAQPILKALQSHWDAVQGELEGGGMAASMEAIEGRLKTALETMQVNMLKAAMPDMDQLSLDVMDYALDNTTESYQALADMFLEAYGDGQTLAEMVASGNFKGASVTTLKQIAEELVNAGFGGEALKNFLKSESSEAGEEAVESARTGWLEGLSNVSEITLKDIKEAMKLGPVGKRLAEASKQMFKSYQYAAQNKLNPEAREALRQQSRNLITAGVRTARKRRDAGNVKGAKQATRQALAPGLEAFGGMTEFQQEVFIEDIIKFQKITPAAVDQLIQQSGYKKELKAGIERANQVSLTPITPVPVTGQPGTGTEAPTEAPVKNFVSGAQQPVPTVEPSTVISPVTKVIKSLSSSAEVLGAITTSVQAVADKVMTGLASAFSGSSTDEVTTAMGGVVDSIAAPQGQVWVKSFDGGVMLANAWTDGESEGIGKGSPAITAAAVSANSAAMAPAIPRTYLSAKPVGEAVGRGIADGIRSKISDIAAALAEATAAAEGQSPPKVGPLKEIDKWGENIGRAWSDGVAQGMARGEEHILETSKSFGPTQVEHRDKKEIKIKLEVSSPDGTANRQKQGELRKGALDAISVMGLEHYMTVG